MYSLSGVSWKASTGQTETQLVNLQSTHFSVTTYVILKESNG
jgi:hypothetical protein